MLSAGQCVQTVKDLYRSSDRVKSLLTAIGGGGGGGEEVTTHLDSLLQNLDCRPCGNSKGEGNARAFIVDNPVNIVLCTNRLTVDDLEEVLVHEMTHAYDYKFGHYDLTTCEGLAASEVRAAREAVRFYPHNCYIYLVIN